MARYVWITTELKYGDKNATCSVDISVLETSPKIYTALSSSKVYWSYVPLRQGLPNLLSLDPNILWGGYKWTLHTTARLCQYAQVYSSFNFGECHLETILHVQFRMYLFLMYVSAVKVSESLPGAIKWMCCVFKIT